MFDIIMQIVDTMANVTVATATVLIWAFFYTVLPILVMCAVYDRVLVPVYKTIVKG